MITIMNEISVDVGFQTERIITLWLVAYGPQPEGGELDAWEFVCTRYGRVLCRAGMAP